MKPGQSLSSLTAKLLLGFEKYFKEERPDLVLAHGDTTTCFATALSSFYHRIPFFHVEAGLRTRRLDSPFPEEFNRQTTAPIASHHFAPTSVEQENLLSDGISPEAITITGSTVHEAIRAVRSKNIESDTERRPIVLVTLHRRESAGSLQNALRGLKLAAMKRPDVLFVCPVHPSPGVQRAFQACLNGQDNISLRPPMEYSKFISLLMRADLVVTDSGGVQEEAAFLGKRVLLARAETERADGLGSGLVKLVGMNSEAIQKAVQRELSCPNPVVFRPERNNSQPPASEIIACEVMRAVGAR